MTAWQVIQLLARHFTVTVCTSEPVELFDDEYME